jgi:hypothetical protein
MVKNLNTAMYIEQFNIDNDVCYFLVYLIHIYDVVNNRERRRRIGEPQGDFRLGLDTRMTFFSSDGVYTVFVYFVGQARVFIAILCLIGLRSLSNLFRTFLGDF